MTRADAISRAREDFKSGAFLAELDRRVAYQTESQNPSRGAELRAYLEQEMIPSFAALDFTSRIVELSPRESDAMLQLLFDDEGQASPFFEQIVDQLGALDQGYRSSADFFAALERYELLEPFSFDVELRDGSSHRLVGYHLIDEEKLRALEPGAINELHSADYLMPIFMALASLSNLARLVERKNQRLAHG